MSDKVLGNRQTGSDVGSEPRVGVQHLQGESRQSRLRFKDTEDLHGKDQAPQRVDAEVDDRMLDIGDAVRNAEEGGID